MGSLEYLTQACDKTPQTQPQNYQGVTGSTSPRAQTGLGRCFKLEGVIVVHKY